MSDTAAPLISVLMGVLNCEKTLDECLESLTAQTESDWECIICDDGSTDRTPEIIREWQQRLPGKIIFLRNEQNCGLSLSLNRCIHAARGKYCARMDGDDRCSPERFEKEVHYLETHPEMAIVSTDMQCFDDDGIWGLCAYPTEPQPKDLVHGTLFCHPACMIRKEALDKVGGYSESERYRRAQDYDLWVRMYAMGYRGWNIHEPLYQYRDDRNAASRRKWKFRVQEAGNRLNAIRTFQLPVWNLVFVLRPVLLGLLPGKVSSFLHRMKVKRSS